jgi:hypothetical protein
MSNQHDRSGASNSSSNTPAEPGRRHESGGNMGAGRSGRKSHGSEKPEHRDNNGSKQTQDKY